MLLVQRLPDQPTHETYLCLPAQMPRRNEVSTAFREKAGQVRLEEVVGTFDILPILPCDSASQEGNPLVWALSLTWETWERIA